MLSEQDLQTFESRREEARQYTSQKAKSQSMTALKSYVSLLGRSLETAVAEIRRLRAVADAAESRPSQLADALRAWKESLP